MRLVWLLMLTGWPVAAWSQGAIIEKLDELPSVSTPPAFRGEPPPRVDLSPTLPQPRAQSNTLTCVSWATTYVAGSQAARRAGISSTIVLSPAFTYNQLTHDPFCHTSTLISATLDLLRETGALPIEKFAFDGGSCGRVPTPEELQSAKPYRIRGWSRFDASDTAAVKSQLARSTPVIFAIRSGPRLSAHHGDGVFDTPEETPGIGHAMVAVGYDDARKAFRIQNSWGKGWGDNGYAWYAYDLWRRTVSVGFVID